MPVSARNTAARPSTSTRYIAPSAPAHATRAETCSGVMKIATASTATASEVSTVSDRARPPPIQREAERRAGDRERGRGERKRERRIVGACRAHRQGAGRDQGPEDKRARGENEEWREHQPRRLVGVTRLLGCGWRDENEREEAARVQRGQCARRQDGDEEQRMADHGGGDRLLAPEARGGRHRGEPECAARERDRRERRAPRETAETAHIELVIGRVHDRARSQEERRLEERVREQME